MMHCGSCSASVTLQLVWRRAKNSSFHKSLLLGQQDEPVQSSPGYQLTIPDTKIATTYKYKSEQDFLYIQHKSGFAIASVHPSRFIFKTLRTPSSF